MKLFFAAVLFFSASLAAAAESPETREAKAHFEKATAAYALAQYAEAATEYELAFKLRPDPALLYNAAQAHRRARNHRRALELYNSYLRIYGARASVRDEVKRHIAELESAIEAESKASTSPPTDPLAVKIQHSDEASKPEKSSQSSDAAPAPTTSTGSVTVSQPPPTAIVATHPSPRPLVKRGWFWGVMAGAAIVVAGAVAVGILFGSPGAPSATLGKVSGN
jgi:tetratricopeptide (TPR) repeat protein